MRWCISMAGGCGSTARRSCSPALGVAVAVALVFAVTVAASSLTNSAADVVRTVAGPADLQESILAVPKGSTNIYSPASNTSQASSRPHSFWKRARRSSVRAGDARRSRSRAPPAAWHSWTVLPMLFQAGSALGREASRSQHRQRQSTRHRGPQLRRSHRSDGCPPWTSAAAAGLGDLGSRSGRRTVARPGRRDAACPSASVCRFAPESQSHLGPERAWTKSLGALRVAGARGRKVLP